MLDAARPTSITVDCALKPGSTAFYRSYVRMFLHRVVRSRREVRVYRLKSALAKAASSDVPQELAPVTLFAAQHDPMHRAAADPLDIAQ